MKVDIVKQTLRWPRWLVAAVAMTGLTVGLAAWAAAPKRVGGPGRFVWMHFARRVSWPIPEECRKAAGGNESSWAPVDTIRGCQITIVDGYGHVYRKRDDSIGLLRKGRFDVLTGADPTDTNKYYLTLMFSGRQIADCGFADDGMWKPSPISEDGELFNADAMWPERITVTIGGKYRCIWRRGETPE